MATLQTRLDALEAAQRELKRVIVVGAGQFDATEADLDAAIAEAAPGPADLVIRVTYDKNWRGPTEVEDV